MATENSGLRCEAGLCRLEKPSYLDSRATSGMDTCAYCGNAAESEDHIPAQGLLRGVPRGARPSVPACLACNLHASDDDEYFRDTVVKYHRVADKPEAAAAFGAMMRALRHPKKRGYAAATLRGLRDRRVITYAGIDLGMQPTYDVDLDRICRCVSRYVRGLHFREVGTRVPSDNVRALANPESLLRDERLGEFIRAGTLRVVKPRVFSYSWFHPYDRPTASVWVLVFFDALPFMGIVHGTDSMLNSAAR